MLRTVFQYARFPALIGKFYLKPAYPEAGERMLSEATIALLNELHFRADAKRMVSLIPLGSIYWEDEMPDLLDIAKLSDEERNMIWGLFGIRFKIWDDQQLAADDKSFWEAARSEVPDWPLFHRLALSLDDRKAREEAERDVEKEFEAFFGDADRVELSDKPHGVQEFSATFDLTKKRGAES
jgi:hypothetical protein